MWDPVESFCKKCKGSGGTVGHGSSQHAQKSHPLKTQDDSNGQRCSSKKPHGKQASKV